MRKQQAPAITNLRYYPNRTKAGNPTASKVSQGVLYYGYGIQSPGHLAERPTMRGRWYSPDNEIAPHNAVRSWAGENALENQYTYTAVLSARDGWMQPGDFNQVMEKAGIFSDWRLIVHTDTEHVHAHVIAFREKTLTKKEFNAWRKAAMAELEQLERQRLQEEEQERIRTQQQTQETGIDIGFDIDD